MSFIEKVKEWAKKFGFTGLLYVPIALIAWSIFGWTHIAFGAICIWAYINVNTIWKLATGVYKKI